VTQQPISRRHQQRDIDMSNVRHIEVNASSKLDPANTIIRFPEVAAITGLARATVYKRLKDDPTFPRPVPLSNSKSRGSPVGFVLAEVHAWVRQRIALRGEAA
jgi:prophage regulatory protein